MVVQKLPLMQAVRIVLSNCQVGVGHAPGYPRPTLNIWGLGPRQVKALKAPSQAALPRPLLGPWRLGLGLRPEDKKINF